MPTIAGLHTLISETLNRGSRYDAYIPSRVRQAALWLERNYSFKYMERYVSFTATATGAEPRILPMPSAVKKIDFIRFGPYDNDWHYLTLVDPRDVIDTEPDENGRPSGYWLDGMDHIWMDAAPEEDMVGEMSYVQYTTWPTDYTQTNWLVTYGEDVLLARAMVHLAPVVRMSPLLVQEYNALLTDGLRTLVGADEEMRQANRDERMQYE